ncbi:MAG: SDR family oxidoreductase [Candidatus Omnitrophica bacterium]|nr:SDR family oxidoreductase [Candidatus Omnitrophota bacterium]
MKTFLVTGGAGFIGSNIVEALIKSGCNKVRVVDNFFAGTKENLDPFLDKIELIEGDIRDKSFMEEICDGVDIILHQAALCSVPRSIDDPVSSNDVNVAGTLNLLVAARKGGVKRVVYASSSSVYGDTPSLPKKEDQRPEPVSPYAVSKLAAEYYCQVFSGIYGLETVSLRYFNVFGPRQDPHSKYAAVVPNFISAILKGRPPKIHGDGKQSRDFTYIDNVVQANLKAAAAPASDVMGRVFNIACGEQHTVLEITETIMAITGGKIKPEFIPLRQGDVLHSLADISGAKEDLGYKPGIGFRDGLKKTVEWFHSLKE